MASWPAQPLPARGRLLAAADVRRWHRRARSRLAGHGAWLLGGEPNTQDPAEFGAAGVRVLIARLSTYRDVAASITHPLLAQISREVPGVYVDHAYLPPPGDHGRLLQAGVALWTGVTSKEPAWRFDVVAISNSYAQELLNLPALLLHSGIPLSHEERMADPQAPLVVIGGANSSALALLHGRAGPAGSSLVDAALIGEAEVILPPFLRVVREARAAGASPRGILEACRGRVPGLYEPARYRHVFGPGPGGRERLIEIRPEGPDVPFPVARAFMPRLDPETALTRGPVPYEADAAGSSAIQADLGCPAFCTFCREGWEVKPYRERTPERLLAILREAKAWQGLDTVHFMSFVINIHSRFYEVLRDALPLFHRVSLKSQRFDILAEDPHMAPFQAALGKTSVTCGVEGISERLRRHMHKNITEGMILSAAEALFRERIRELKLFFIATGLEREEDVREFARLLEALSALRRDADARTRIIASVTPLVAMPNTPSQFRACDLSALEGNPLAGHLEPICRRAGAELRASAEGAEAKLGQILLRADRRFTPALVRSSLELGFVYHRGVPEEVFRAWERLLADEGVPREEVLRARSQDEVLPWDDVTCGVPKAHLWEQYQKSLRDEEGEYCLNRITVPGKCFDCGGCPEPFQIRDIVRKPIAVPVPLEEIAAIEARKRNPHALRLLLDRDPELAPAPKRFFQVAAARGLLLSDPGLVDHYLRPGPIQDEDLPADHAAGLLIADLLLRPEAPLERAAAGLDAVNGHLRGFRVVSARPRPEGPIRVDRVLYAIGAGPEAGPARLELRRAAGWTVGRFPGGCSVTPPKARRGRLGVLSAALRDGEERLLVLASPGVSWERALRAVAPAASGAQGIEGRIEVLFRKAAPGESPRCEGCRERVELDAFSGAPGGRVCAACRLAAGIAPEPVPASAAG